MIMVAEKVKSDIKNPALADAGENRIRWAAKQMGVIKLITERFSREKPLRDLNISACLHVTSETANLMLALKAGGASIALCASNPLSTQDDVAASLVVNHAVSVFAITGEDNKTYYNHLRAALDHKPVITMDDGADLVSELHKGPLEATKGILGSTEETTTGVIRLRSMERDNVLRFPVISVNDADTKHLFDNRYGTGQSTLDGIIRATNVLIAGLKVVVVGYGMCGKGVAMRAKGLGAHVIVTEVNPVRAIEANLDGFEVLPMSKAAPMGDLFVTVTGNTTVLDVQHFAVMKDGAIISNSGHFNVEINLVGLKAMSSGRRVVRPFVEEYKMKDGRLLHVLAEGRLINLAAAEGHPGQVMDMSFANQALSAEYLVKHHKELEKRVYVVPKEIDEQIAALKLASMGVQIDTLTEKQKKYLASWEEGT